MEKTFGKEEDERLILKHLWEMMTYEIFIVVKMSIVGF